MKEEIYKKYGGFTTIRTLVISFYDKVEKNELLAPYFKNTDMSKLIHHQTLFLTKALGGPDEYEGRSLGEAHKELKINDKSFKTVLSLLAEVCGEHGVEDKDIELIIDKITKLKDQIVSK